MRLPYCLEPFWGCCLFRFLPAVKATYFAGFPFFRCLFPLHKPRKATNFAKFPFFRCLLASSKMRRIPCRQARNGKCQGMSQEVKTKKLQQAYCSLFVLIRILLPKFYCKSACYYLPHNHAPGKHQKNRCRKKTSNQCKLHPCRNACP